MQTKGERSQRKVATEIDDSDIDAAIKVLQEESRQMIELVEIQKTNTAEAVIQFKRIIESIGLSYDVKAAWGTARSDIDKVVLTSQGIVCVTLANGNVQSKPLESIGSETVLKILTIAIPKVKEIMTERRQITSLRAGILERVARELAKVSGDAEPHPTH